MSIQKREWQGRTTYRVRVYHKRKVVADRSFDFRREAEDFEIEIKAQVKSGTFINRSAAENMTLSEAMDSLVDAQPTKKKKAEFRSRSKQIKKYEIASLPLASVRKSDVVLFREARQETHSENDTRLCMDVISQAFNHASERLKMDYLNNPAKHVKRPSVKGSARDRTLRPGEYERLITSAEQFNNTMRYIILFALETAMRQGEIASITQDMINHEKRLCCLPKTKNEEPRKVPLSKTAYAIVEKMIEAGNNPIFDYASAHSISKQFRKITESAKSKNGKKKEPLVNLKFHDLRHEATTNLFKKGLSTEQVKAITGHKTYQMLARYTHLAAEDLVDLLD